MAMWRVIVEFWEPNHLYPVAIHAFQGTTQHEATRACAEHFGLPYAELVDDASRTGGAQRVRIDRVPDQQRG